LYASPIITGNSQFCSGDSVQLISTSAAKYLWNTGDTINNIWVKSGGNYSVKITYSNQCEKLSDKFNVAQLARPADSITVNKPNATICAGDSVTLSMSGTNTYVWNTGATTTSINVKDSGTYRVLITGVNGCTDSTAQVVTVNVVNCVPPSSGINSAVTSSTATITWDILNCARGYKIQYRIYGSLSWTNKSVSAIAIPTNTGKGVIKNLTPGTVYEGRIATKCSTNPDVYSSFSPSFTFTTLSSSAIISEMTQSNTELSTKMSVQPNPNNGNFTVLFTASSSSPGDLTVYNSLGEVIYNKSVALVKGQNNIQINMQNVASGIYLVQLKTNDSVNNQKIVKQ